MSSCSKKEKEEPEDAMCYMPPAPEESVISGVDRPLSPTENQIDFSDLSTKK